MYLGHQTGDYSDSHLTWLAQLGVEHLIANSTRAFDIENPDGTWNLAGVRELRNQLARFGMTMDGLTLDMQAAHLLGHRFPGIVWGRDSRDAEIEVIKQNIRVAGESGVPMLKYNLNPLGFGRTGSAPGRGGSRYSHFDIDEWTDHTLTELGPMSAERIWEITAYFLERVIPVAEQFGVRMACHPHDPAVPRDTGLRGIHTTLGSVAGLKKFVEIAPSPLNGFNFCVGTVSEMLDNPANEIGEVVRHFAERQRIFMIHLRNIKGRYLHFDEVYHDNGDVDLYGVIRTLGAAGYDGIVCPDHVPQSDVDPDYTRGFSFGLGYIRGLLHAAEVSPSVSG